MGSAAEGLDQAEQWLKWLSYAFMWVKPWENHGKTHWKNYSISGKSIVLPLIKPSIFLETTHF